MLTTMNHSTTPNAINRGKGSVNIIWRMPSKQLFFLWRDSFKRIHSLALVVVLTFTHSNADTHRQYSIYDTTTLTLVVMNDNSCPILCNSLTCEMHVRVQWAHSSVWLSACLYVWRWNGFRNHTKAYIIMQNEWIDEWVVHVEWSSTIYYPPPKELFILICDMNISLVTLGYIFEQGLEASMGNMLQMLHIRHIG